MSQSQYSPEHRAAALLFKLLGKPKEHAGKFNDWLVAMRDCLGEAQLEIEEMKTFLRWAVETNDYSRKYLMLANDPMATLRKNLPGLLRRWRVENPPIDPDPLWKDVSIPGFDGDEPLVQKHVRRKPKNTAERRELLALPRSPRWGVNPNVSKWLAQDECPKCKGRGAYNERVHPEAKSIKRRFQECVVTCECVFMEELL